MLGERIQQEMLLLDNSRLQCGTEHKERLSRFIIQESLYNQNLAYPSGSAMKLVWSVPQWGALPILSGK